MKLSFRRKRPATPTQPTAAPPAPGAQPANPGEPVTVAPQPGPAVASPPGAEPTAVQPQAQPAGVQAARPAPSTASNAAEIESLRAWIAQLDRRIGTRTYLAAAMTLLAVAAAAVALVLAVDARDNSASDDDLNAIESDFNEIAEQAAAGAGAEAQIESLEGRIAELEAGADATATDPGSLDESLDLPTPGEAEGPATEVPPVDGAAPDEGSGGGGAKAPEANGAKRDGGVR